MSLDQRRVVSSTDSTAACTEEMQWGELGGLVRVCYPSGHPWEDVTYDDLARGYRRGVATSWHNNGQRDGLIVRYIYHLAVFATPIPPARLGGKR